MIGRRVSSFAHGTRSLCGLGSDHLLPAIYAGVPLPCSWCGLRCRFSCCVCSAAVRSACSRAVVAPVAAVVPRLSVAAYSTLGELVAERTAAKPRHEVLRVPHQDIVWDNTDLKVCAPAWHAG